ncbi:hypothetical protein [uncultured Prevotella sp.]|uniref:hypothetical protein n=1 Tax=uncultured Prevotella sp. TaxID=159272 RepID=UPI00258FB122|nr:hypothetical protein [uncultured Prevotella sp.]
MAWILNYQPKIEHQHIHMGNQAVEDESKSDEAEVMEDTPDAIKKKELADGDLIEKLKPIFFNNEDDVRLFLKEIKGMKSNDITDLVNRWVKEKRISDYGNSRKGVLWRILHEAGLYTKTKSNWNGRVS